MGSFSSFYRFAGEVSSAVIDTLGTPPLGCGLIFFFIISTQLSLSSFYRPVC